MEEVPKSFVKVLLSALIRLEFYNDAELSFDDIVAQAEGRTPLSSQELVGACNKYIRALKELAAENPAGQKEFLEKCGFGDNEISAIEEIWAEEKGLVLKRMMEKKEIQWTVKGEPTWSIDIQTLGKASESVTLPIANFKFDLVKFGVEKTLQFSAEKKNLGQLLNALEQANLFLSSNIS